MSKKMLWFLMICFLFMMLVVITAVSTKLDFQSGIRQWQNQLDNKIFKMPISLRKFKCSLLSGVNSLIVHCQKGDSILENIQVSPTVQLKKGRIYHFSFMAMADVQHKIKIEIEKSSKTYWESDSILLTSTPSSCGVYDFDCLLTDGSYTFKFMLGGLDSVNVTLDSIVMTMTPDPNYPRPEDAFEICTHSFQGRSLPFRLFIPKRDDSLHRYPIVLTLHGAGERGTNNEI